MTVPLSLRGKYQVLIAPAGEPRVAEHATALMLAVRQAMGEFGVDARKFLVRVGSGGDSEPEPRQPIVAVFFGLEGLPPEAAAAEVERLLENGVLVIPVVENKARFAALVPASIAHLNGVSLAECGASFERLAARVLEGFGLLRERRRLFVSYRRVDASGVAAQLYEALDAAGFDVFLDTHGALRPGEPFQEVLWHRLADTEVAVLLDTPGFLDSRWTEEELARANTSNLQVLQVLWPGQELLAPAAFSAFHVLETVSFAAAFTLGLQARLTEDEVSRIVDSVEGLRARALAARHNFLVREFVREAKDVGLQACLTPDRLLVVRGRLPEDGEQHLLVLPAVGVPDAEQYEALQSLRQREAEAGRDYLSPPVLLYDESGIRARWISHLRWLNANLSCARGVALTEAREWLLGIVDRGGRS